jgi:hypothetical protein
VILYSVIVTFTVVVFLAFKGPAEVYFLQTMGIDLVDAFEASFGFDSTKILVKGGLAFGLLIVQPLAFAGIFLKILDKIFASWVISKVDAEVAIKAISLERHEEMVRRGQQGIDQKRVSEAEHVGVGTTGISGTATMSISDGLYKREKLDWSYIGIAKRMVRFRGSRKQLLTAQVLLFLCVVSVFVGRVEWLEFPMFWFLLVFVGPSYILYLMFLARFVNVQKTNQRRAFEQLATELRTLGEMRHGRYCFQSNESAYWLFQYLPAIRRFATVVPVI